MSEPSYLKTIHESANNCLIKAMGKTQPNDKVIAITARRFPSWQRKRFTRALPFSSI